jgi:hypothetical protein
MHREIGSYHSPKTDGHSNSLEPPHSNWPTMVKEPLFNSAFHQTLNLAIVQPLTL